MALVPLPLVTVTSTVPLPGGAIATIEFWETVIASACFEPNQTCDSLPNLAPVI